MGAGASTEFYAEGGALGDGDPTEPVSDEGYDSDLASDFKDLWTSRQKPERGEPTVDPSKGRLSANPAIGGAAAAGPAVRVLNDGVPTPAPDPAFQGPAFQGFTLFISLESIVLEL